MTSLADELLTAHVEYEIARLRGPGLGTLLAEHVKASFAWFDEITLREVVTPEQILGVIERYVIELRLSGGITELAGQMAQAVYSSRASAETQLDDLVGYETYAEFAEKVMGLESAQREVMRSVTESAAFESLAGRALSRAVVEVLFGDGGSTGSRLRRLVSTLGQKIAPGLEPELSLAVGRYVEQRAGRLAREGTRHVLGAMNPEWLRQVGDDLWDSFSSRRIAEAGTVLSPQDLEDFVVLGLEQWMKFRKTPYFRQVTTEVVRQFFTKYGDETVSAIIQDMGVTEAMVVSEVQGFAGPLVERAHQSGFLEARLRAQFEPFYRSQAARALLER